VSEFEAVSEPDIDVVVNRLAGSAHGYELRDTSEVLLEPRSRTKVHRGRPRVEVELGRRAPWEHKPTPPNPVVETRPARQWPLLLLGAFFAVFGWSGLVDLSYPYGSGLQEWQLSVRVLAIALLGLTVAGSGRGRAARVVSIGVLLLAAVLSTTYANYLMDFPFGLKDVVPDTRTALYGAVRKATEFTVVAVLFFSWLSWYLWRIERMPQTESHQTSSPKR
jgi:hypothetical protein